MCKVDIRYSVQRNCLNDSSLKINGCNVELQGVKSKFLIPSIQINHLLMQKKKKDTLLTCTVDRIGFYTTTSYYCTEVRLRKSVFYNSDSELHLFH